MIVTATFGLMAAKVTAVIDSGYFVSASYSNPYPFPLVFQVIDMNPKVGNHFIYSYTMSPMTTNGSIPYVGGFNVNELFAKILFPRG